MKQKAISGFTLVEVVVVIAVVALLSAIIVPLVARQIDSAKIGRAQNECLVISAAILKFQSDTGVFPAGYGGTGGGVEYNIDIRLVSGTAVATGSDGTEYGYTSATNDDWYDGGEDLNDSPADIDIFDHHLNQNAPGLGSDPYATTGEFRWKGPYLAPIGMDPWGRPYVCNIVSAYSGTNKQCVVLSAGPNGQFDTAGDPAGTVTGPSGDDIWAVVRLR